VSIQERAWWTGKDSNLRSPQGAADLQSAGFSHSPTRPSLGLPGFANATSSFQDLQHPETLKNGGTKTPVPKIICRQILMQETGKNTKWTRV
jgi:hypothetical protein